MTEIFHACLDRGADVIFLTPNMMNTYLADDVPDEFRKYAKLTEEYQNSGKMDAFVAAGIEIAQQMHVTVCDCYKEWKKLYAEGVDTTKLLINRLNHPSRKCTVFLPINCSTALWAPTPLKSASPRAPCIRENKTKKPTSIVGFFRRSRRYEGKSSGAKERVLLYGISEESERGRLFGKQSQHLEWRPKPFQKTCSGKR